MSKRTNPAIKKAAPVKLPESYARALVAFYVYFEREKVEPSQAKLAVEMERSKSSARQALDYLTAAGMLTHTGAYAHPWKLTLAGRRKAIKLSKPKK